MEFIDFYKINKNIRNRKPENTPYQKLVWKHVYKLLHLSLHVKISDNKSKVNNFFLAISVSKNNTSRSYSLEICLYYLQ